MNGVNSLMISSLKAKKVSKISFNETLYSSEDNLFQELNHRFRNILQHPNGNILLLTDGPRGKLIEISPPEESRNCNSRWNNSVLLKKP